MGKIFIEDIEVYGYHGHMPEERKIGSNFIVNIELDAAFEDACMSDKIKDTFDYEAAYKIVVNEMNTPSSLLEHVCNRIADKLLKASHLIWSVTVKVSKMNPPFGGNVKAVSVEIIKERDS